METKKALKLRAETKKKNEYETFSDALKTVLSVPRSGMVAVLAEEKVRKAGKKAQRDLTEAMKASLATKPPKKRKVAGD